MLVQRDRERAIHAAIYFLVNTQQCMKTKLMKLLYLLDFEHYRQTGRTVTSLAYEAWEQGPVAKDVWDGLRLPFSNWRQHIQVNQQANGFAEGEPTYPLIAKTEFDPALFSPRELLLLAEVAAKYRTATARELVDLCHLQPPWCKPWRTVWEEQNLQQKQIDPDLFLVDCPDAEAIREVAREHQEFSSNYA